VNVTREVVRDLWSLCASGEASDDTRQLVDAYLASDAELARTLRRDSPAIDARSLELPPDHEGGHHFGSSRWPLQA
jgi:hypothetical protein